MIPSGVVWCWIIITRRGNHQTRHVVGGDEEVLYW
jgi:hypothetical protein